MSKRQINIFISHSWRYSLHYEKLAEWIFDRNWRFGQAVLSLRNYSVPESDPIVGARSDRQLREAIHRQMRLCHVVIIPTGMYIYHSLWMRREVQSASRLGKPILAVGLRGALRTPRFVEEYADLQVGWTARSVVAGVWRLYRDS